MKHVILYLLIVQIWATAYAQNVSYHLVPDDDGNIEDAHFIIAEDSLFQKQIFTQPFTSNPVVFDRSEYKNKCYYIQVSHLNYYPVQKKVCAPFSSVDTIHLYNIPNQLNEIVIQGTKKTKIAVSGNTAQLSPGKIFKAGNVNTSTLLKSIPEIFVLPQGDIKIRGQSVQKIYLYMSENSPGIQISKSEMNALDAESIDKIITLYNEGEIHIYKKQIEEGYRIKNNINVTKGKKFYASLHPHFSYYKNKTAFWLDIPLASVNQTLNSNTDYMVSYDNQPVNLNSESISDIKNKNIRLKSVFEWYINTSNTLGIRMSYGIHNSNKKDALSSAYGNFSTIGEGLFTNKKHVLSSSVYYNTSFLKQWDATIKTGFLAGHQINDLESAFIYDVNNNPSNGNQTLYKDNNSIGFIEEIKLKRSFKSGQNLEINLKNTTVNAFTDINTSQELPSIPVIDSIFKDRLFQNNTEIRTQLGFKIRKKVNVELSAAYLFYHQFYQNTDDDNRTTYSRGYFKPSINLTFPIRKTNFTLFSKRIIKMVDLSKYIYNTYSSDGFTVNENNQDLKPAVYNQFGLSTSLFKGLYSTILYTHGENAFMYYPSFDEQGVSLGSKQINLSKDDQWGISLFYSKYLSNKIFISTNLSLTRTLWENKDPYPFDTGFTSALFNQTLYFMPNDKWSFNMDFSYRSKSKLSETLSLKSWALLNLSASRKLNKYFNVYLKVNDLFRGYRLDIFSTKDNVPYDISGNFDFSFINVGLKFDLSKNYKAHQKTKDNMQLLEKRLELKKDSN